MYTLNRLKTYNRLCKEMDIVYHGYAKHCGLSDMAYWILYSMAESEAYFTQRDFCNAWFFAPQTVNSALKDLTNKELIFLESVEGNKKNKLIKPTKNGEVFIQKYIRPLIDAECESFAALSKEECDAMLSVTEKYLRALKEKVNVLQTRFSRQ